MSRFFLAALTAAGLALVQPALAEQVVVSFAKGTSSQTLKGSIKGDQSRDYIVDARAGQTLTVDFKPSNASAYFNVIAPGADSAMFIGSTEGNRFSGPLTTSGRHTVQVYLMRNAARRNEVANYTITIGVTGCGSRGTSDPATMRWWPAPITTRPRRCPASRPRMRRRGAARPA